MGKKSRKKNPTRSSSAATTSPLGEGLRRMGQQHRNNMMRDTFSELNSFDHLSLDETKATIRALLREIGTDVTQNDANPTGNGDQSRIKSEKQRDSARKLYAIGGDIFKHMEQQAFSDFATKCLGGFIPGVHASLNNLKEKADTNAFPPRSKERELLLERREGSLRLSPLLLLVSAGKNIKLQPGTDISKFQIDIAKDLLRAGASPVAQDVLGKTVCHYGAGAFATDMTLKIVDMCIRASESCKFYGKDVELHGLQKVEMNGRMGVAGGYDPDSERRAFYFLLEDKVKEVWVKPANMMLVGNRLEGSQNEGRDRTDEIPLTDVQDRLGSVSLHEVVMQDRVDVAEFLLVVHSASIHIEDADGFSPLKLAISGSMMASGVAKLVFDVTRKEGMKTSRKMACGNCQKYLGKTEGLRCTKCKAVIYCNSDCQMSHWNNGHKEECKSLKAVAKGVRLQKPLDESSSHTISLSSFSLHQGSYRIPDGVQPGEMFVIKVQGGGDKSPIMVYDKSRTCQFYVNPEQPGFREILVEMRKEAAWQGRKTFMKACFEDGDCIVYPATAGVKAKYSW